MRRNECYACGGSVHLGKCLRCGELTWAYVILTWTILLSIAAILVARGVLWMAYSKGD